MAAPADAHSRQPNDGQYRNCITMRLEVN